MTVLVSISYVVEIVSSPFFRIQVSEITVVFALVLISPSLVVVYPPSSLIIIERVIRFSSPDSPLVLRLSRFPTRRRLREWSSFI